MLNLDVFKTVQWIASLRYDEMTLEFSLSRYSMDQDAREFFLSGSMNKHSPKIGELLGFVSNFSCRLGLLISNETLCIETKKREMSSFFASPKP